MEGYHMRKSEREITDPGEMKDIIRNGTYAILSMVKGSDPYVVTLSYGYDPERSALYFHTASDGLKLDIIGSNNKVCGTVIDDLGYVHGECSHRYRSVVLYGVIHEVVDLGEKKIGMMTMFRHLEKVPDEMKERFLSEDRSYSKFKVLRMDISRITGKKSE